MSDTRRVTSTQEKVVVGGALVGGLIFFGFLTGKCQNPLNHLRSTEVATAVTDLNADVVDRSGFEAQITDLEGEIEVLKDNSADERVIADLEAKLFNQKAQAEESIAGYRKRSADLESQIKRLSAAPAAAVAEVPVDSSVFTSQISDLEGKLEVSEMNGKDLAAKLSALTLAAKDTGAHDKLSEKVKNLNQDNKGLAKELSKTKEQLKNMRASLKDGNSAAAKLGELEEANKSQKAMIKKKNNQIAGLSAQINKLKAAKNVFVESADDLPGAARALFADLKTLEGKSEAEVQAAYASYVAKHGATAKKRIKFKSGSSNVSDNYKKEIAELTEAAGDNTYFFIVGYADQTGTAASNKKLSSSRSTSVAKELGSRAKGLQSAQAVYLGQTDRFGASSENRVVEIWEIK